jgi:DNA modification methylase
MTPTLTHASPEPTDEQFATWQQNQSIRPLFLTGAADSVLAQLPANIFDCAITSPPYWGQRTYSGGGIGQEDTYQQYVANLLTVFAQVRRVLKPTGSFWLNLGDAYQNKNLLGLPWRVAHALTDTQGWVLRNSVVWNKVKGGMDNATDKLRNVHELLFHFVRQPKGYFYDVSAVRQKPRSAKVVNGAVVSATGVSGVRYRRQIELSTALTEAERKAAYIALDQMLDEVRAGSIADFRMIIRGVHRATHSDSEAVSGRARELRERGFYFLRYHPDGSKLGDVWDILPEDTQKRKSHFAPFPEDLCKLPVLATCPEDGVVLDPFCGTGTANYVAYRLGRKSVGIDTSDEYIRAARERCRLLL